MTATTATTTDDSLTLRSTTGAAGRSGLRTRSARLAFVAAATVAGLGVTAGSAAADTPPAQPDVEIAIDEPTCPKDGKIDVVGSHSSITVVAPEGTLIAGYCVKAGSIQQGNGPEHVVVNPPAEEVTFSHSSGKDISHYTVVYVDEPIDDKAPPPPADEPEVPGDVTNPDPEDEPEVPGDVTNPDPEDEPEVPGDVTNPDPLPEPEPQPESETPEFESQAPAPQPEPQPQPQPQPEQEPVVPTGELPVTGSTTTLLAVIAAGLTSLGLGVRGLGRRAA